MQIPLSAVFMWIKKYGKIVEEMVQDRQENEDEDKIDKIEILELDEAYGYYKIANHHVI